MFRNISLSIADIFGHEYAQSLARASSAVGNMKYNEAQALVEERADFIPASDLARAHELLSKVGTQLVPEFENDIDGAPTDSFRHAENKSAAPMAAFGSFRIGEDGRLLRIFGFLRGKGGEKGRAEKRGGGK